MMFSLLFLVSVHAAPSVQPAQVVTHGNMVCGAPVALATSTTQTVRYCRVVK